MRANRRGFATATALIMLALLGTVAAAMIADLRSQARRTLGDQEEAQLRQLLHAGGVIAGDLPNVWGATGVQKQTFKPTLPAEIGGSVEVAVGPGADASAGEAVVRAKVGDRAASETIRFARVEGKWAVVAVESDDVR